MSAGDSARREGERARLLAAEYERRLVQERERAASFGVASRAEAAVATVLRPLEQWGWRLLEDRRWPGTRTANIDLVLIGPGGVFVLDVKAWAEPDIVDGRLYRGQVDASDEIDKLLRQAESVTDVAGANGLAPGEVVPVLVFVGQRRTAFRLARVRVLDDHSVVPWALRRGDRIEAAQVARIAAALDAALPPHDRPAPVSSVVPEPVLPLSRHGADESDALFDADALYQALVARMQTAPVEEWMTFLHPEQQRLVRRIGSGPSRVRGPAGTGKTVLALHRAAYLAESIPGPVLFTTFVNTLPPVLAALYARLSPATTDRVEFVNLHRWAKNLLLDRGHRLPYDRRGIERAYARAWSRQGKDSALREVGVPWTYWRDEIDYVIKGRGITEFEQYAGLRRVGRRTRLTQAHRRLVWRIYADYDENLRSHGLTDSNDMIDLTLAELRETPLEAPYAAVVADEVQDLTCQAVRLLAAMSDGGERLLLIGDGQQQIYPGGYTLAEAGLQVAGRSTLLRVNYRNGAHILEAANDVVAEDDFEDLDGTRESGRRDTATARDGGQVWHVRASTAEELRHAAVDHARRLLAEGHDPGGIAILCTTNGEALHCLRLLAGEGLPVVSLTDYAGTPVDAIKVGTVERAKGLEFKHVIHPLVTSRHWVPTSEDGTREQREIANRKLFVAMTRARDSVWVGRVA